jgi:hypothetical protein
MELRWNIHKEYGYLEIIPRVYDEEYFVKYIRYADTLFGKVLLSERMAFVDRWHQGKLLDVGIGSGQFMLARKDTFGYDINSSVVKLLKETGYYANINDTVFPAYSFFDSFEHIKDHSHLLNSMPPKTKIFMSIPIFSDTSHVLSSKHFRPDEHYWYFTTQGLIRYMCDYGFCCLDIDNFEIRVGREDIWSFVFEKREI